MSNRCSECKFHDWDVEWDEEIEDEAVISICRIGHEKYLESGEKCPFFKKFKSKPYVEKDTECDKCEFISECIEEGNVISVTRLADERQHYVAGIGCLCKKVINK